MDVVHYKAWPLMAATFPNCASRLPLVVVMLLPAQTLAIGLEWSSPSTTAVDRPSTLGQSAAGKGLSIGSKCKQLSTSPWQPEKRLSALACWEGLVS